MNEAKQDVFRGEIYWAESQAPTGAEQMGLRPWLIISNNLGNKYGSTVVCAALSTKPPRQGFIPHVYIGAGEAPQAGRVMLEQIHTFEKARLKEYAGRASEATMKSIDAALAVEVGVTPSDFYDKPVAPDLSTMDTEEFHEVLLRQGVKKYVEIYREMKKLLEG